MTTLLIPIFNLLLFNIFFFSSVSAEAQTIGVDIKVYLEGAFDQKSGQMHTKLYDLGYLPGMKPKAFFAEPLPYFDPYDEFYDQGLKVRSDAADYTAETVDMIYVSIQNSDTGDIVSKRTALLNSNGVISGITIPRTDRAELANYTIILAHRNHLPVESPPTKMEGGKLSFDFTTSDISGLKDKEEVRVMIAGNIDQTKTQSKRVINMDDISVWRTANGKNSSYLREDVNMDGDVSIRDQSLILENLELSTSVRIHE